MYSIAGSLPRPVPGRLSNTNSNCYRPLAIPLRDTTQATTSIPLGNGGGLDEASGASDMSNMAEFDDNTEEFKMTQDGFETNAAIGGLYFIFFDT